MALFQVDEHSGIPLWVQLRNRFIYLIDSGYYKNGDKLPTVRAIAADLNINYHTVNKVYLSLEHDHYVSTKRGKGAFVTRLEGEPDENLPGDVILAEGIRHCIELGMTTRDIEQRFGRVLKGYKALADDKPDE
ncbi:MAG: GntR family transcriptional regulator [Raoultibacter sp.]